MIRRLLITLLAWGCGIAALHAAGSVTVGGAQGEVGGKVEIAVELTTSTADVVAAEIHIPLPDGVTPVAGSCVKSDSRLPSHSVSADMKGGDYVVVIYNASLQPIPAGSGKAFSFKLDLGENPGVFDLTPRVKMSDASGNAVPATGSGGQLTVLGARLALGATDIDFGRVPIRGTYTSQVTATNTGTAALDFSEFTTDVPGLSVSAASQSLSPGESTVLTLDYQPVERAKSIAGRFTAVSNSVGRAPFVRVTSVPFSVNELHVSNAEGVSDSEVVVSLTMNNMEPIVGAEVTFVLPDALEYVDGSLKASQRASRLSTAASFGNDRRLRLVLYGAGNEAVTGDDGELMSFRLKLAGRSGYYSLNPEKVILSNRDSENMVSATGSGYVVITSPSLSAASEFNIGNVPLSGADTFDYSVNNWSSVPLTIEKVSFLDNVAECKADFPMVIAPNGSGKIPVTIKNPQFGDFVSMMNVYTNDPDNRLKTVTVSGRFYSPNELSLSGSLDDDNYLLTVSLTNEAEIVAMQCDVVVPQGVSLTSSDLQLLERAKSHNATLASVGDNRYRIVIFSLENVPFAGNSGAVFALSVPAQMLEGKQIRFENVKLSSKDGVNFTTPDTEVMVDNGPVFAQEIRLSRTSVYMNIAEELQLTATVLPENATDKTVTWSSSNESVATVDATGKVTAVALGEAVITATCGSVSVTCAVYVVETPVILPLAVSIEVSPTEIVANPGKTYSLNVKITPEEAAAQELVWTSSDPAIATVSPEGVVEIISVGSAAITVSTTDGSGLSAICLITGISGADVVFSDPDMKADIYNIRGQLLMHNATDSDFQQLPAGIYIIRGAKIIKR